MARKAAGCALGALFILTQLIVAFPAYGMGSRENPLARADELIKEQKYDEAVLLLTDYIKENPENFDQAQARLRKIVEIRNAYNKRASELLKSLVDDPRNQEKHIALIRELETLERHPNPEVQQFVEDTKLTILFTLNRVQFEDIMAGARDLTDKGRYVEAAREYSTGFSLYRPEFEFGNYDPITVKAVLARVDEVGPQIDRYAASQSALTASCASLQTAFASGDPARIDAALPAAEEALASLANLRAETMASGRALERQFEIFQSGDPTLTDSSFLPFAFRFILGRATEERPEGVTGTMAEQWAALFDSSAGAADAELKRRFSEAEKNYMDGDYRASNAGFLRVQDLASRALRFQSLWSLFLPTDIEESARAFGRGLVATRGTEYLRFQHLRDTAGAYAALASLRRDLAAAAESVGAAAAAMGGLDNTAASFKDAAAKSLETYGALRSAALQSLRAVETLADESQGRADELKRLTDSGLTPPGAADIQVSLDERLSQSLNAAKALETQDVALTAKTEVDLLDGRLASLAADLARSRVLLEGASAPDAPLGSLVSTYPTRSLQLILQTDQGLKTLQKDTAALLSRYSGETPYIASAPSVVIQVERARALDSSIAQRIAEGNTLAAAARDRQRQAQSNRMEADLRLQEARAALSRENFDVARERLERARERYLASLSFEDDSELRARSDSDLEALGTQIVRAENDRVVRETRRLLTEGKGLYNQGEFARSEESLLQARARWKVTHTDEPEPEVEYWLRLVQTALSVKTGRDIPQTAPLYPEMSQLLSLAKMYYEEGKAALDKRDRVAALQAFDMSRKKIQEVKVIFPLNQEARVLELRINQLSDPDAFNRDFARLVSAARTKIDAKEDLQTVYSDLLDLRTINPNYPGLKALIERLEILIGLRLPPPDPKALAESRTLTAAAQRIFDSREVAQFSTALAQLNRALELDPNNETASRLKDRILTYVGGTTALVLPSAGETLFNEAVAFFQNGDYLNARIRLTRLYETYPQARKVQKVSDLDSRLTARGY